MNQQWKNGGSTKNEQERPPMPHWGRKAMRDSFNLDLDNHNKPEVKMVFDALRSMAIVQKIVVSRNLHKHKHYHIEVILTKPIPEEYLLYYRLAFQDHISRMLRDVERLRSMDLETFDYVGDRKYSVDLKKENIQLKAKYKEVYSCIKQ